MHPVPGADVRHSRPAHRRARGCRSRSRSATARCDPAAALQGEQSRGATTAPAPTNPRPEARRIATHCADPDGNRAVLRGDRSPARWHRRSADDARDSAAAAGPAIAAASRAHWRGVYRSVAADQSGAGSDFRSRCRRRMRVGRRAFHTATGPAHTDRCAHPPVARAPVLAKGNPACRVSCPTGSFRSRRASVRCRNR